MNKLELGALNKLRRIVLGGREPADDGPALTARFTGQAGSDVIRERLLSPEPCMVTRLGRTELRTILRRWNRRRSRTVLNVCRYVCGRQGPFWWDDEIRRSIQDLSGVFPATDELLDRFSDRYIQDFAQTDILGAWSPGEAALRSAIPHAQIVRLQDLEPYYHGDPWTTSLKGRTVLVIHPFAITIREQYKRRALLFANPKILPGFTLKILKAVQSLGGVDTGYSSWFDALDWMCARVGEIEFDVALIGAGAYGLPLAAFIKGLGKKAVHLGGATQVLFGIRGKRWDERPFFQSLLNENWIRPLPEETPDSYLAVESGCYW